MCGPLPLPPLRPSLSCATSPLLSSVPHQSSCSLNFTPPPPPQSALHVAPCPSCAATVHSSSPSWESTSLHSLWSGILGSENNWYHVISSRVPGYFGKDFIIRIMYIGAQLNLNGSFVPVNLPGFCTHSETCVLNLQIESKHDKKVYRYDFVRSSYGTYRFPQIPSIHTGNMSTYRF